MQWTGHVSVKGRRRKTSDPVKPKESEGSYKNNMEYL